MINYKQIFYLISALWIMSAIVFATTTISDTSSSFTGNLAVDTNTLYVDGANNRVGIGTTSPTRKLTIAGTNDDTILMTRDTYTIVSLGDNGGDNGELTLYNGTGTVGARISPNRNSYMNVYGGNVGIGTTSPDYANLEVKSTTGLVLTPSLSSGGFFTKDNIAGNINNGYGGGYWLGTSGRTQRFAGITSYQDGSDPDYVGIKFYIHGGTLTGDNMTEGARIDRSGYIKPATGYKSDDGTIGMTGSCGAATTLTVKDGLITGCA